MGNLFQRKSKYDFWAGVKWLCITYVASLYTIGYTRNISKIPKGTSTGFRTFYFSDFKAQKMEQK